MNSKTDISSYEEYRNSLQEALKTKNIHLIQKTGKRLRNTEVIYFGIDNSKTPQNPRKYTQEPRNPTTWDFWKNIAHKLLDIISQRLKGIKTPLLPSILAASLTFSAPAPAQEDPKVNRIEQTELSKKQEQPLGKVLIIGQNHYKVGETLKAIRELQKLGAKNFAVELPEDYGPAVTKFLQSKRTPNDKVTLSKETLLHTALDQKVIEAIRVAKQSMYRTLGDKTTIPTTQEIIDQQQKKYGNKDLWTGSFLPMLEMMEKTHDLGMKVVCIDMDDIKQKDLPSIFSPHGQQENVSLRNATMAGNLSKLAKEGNTIAAVGASHTGKGDHTSLNERLKNLGIKCLSIDTPINEHIDSKIDSSNKYYNSDRMAISPGQIIDAFKELTTQKEKEQTKAAEVALEM